MSSQLVLDLPRRFAYDEGDFFVTARNGRAFGLVGQWPDWHAPAAVIWGPPQSGKTYLAHIWSARANAAFADPALLGSHIWAAPWQPLVLEDVDASGLPETALFHHLNLAREHGSFILLTARTPPGSWRIALPDLRSRIRSYPTAEIQPPDEEHLAALLLKHFSDRGIEIAPDVIAYLVQRIERSMAAADAVASLLDKAALAERRRITRSFAAKVLKAAGGGPDSGDDEPDDGI
ncbi:HdaA/DnaA family protein [Rhodomicrobium lacus]|jgi:chromosomal replication initiation ATPase DnaA|uniref:HdaA/DnaA family protein n=1 Tax=Rhodomicrobium TaxID=1068 RepID=UPI000F8E530B|nr:DnaA/Hda family protein [Rhodomicrobium lacus]WKW51135.1 DnaA/Hda family protein [Rhodomicrobium lacus]